MRSLLKFTFLAFFLCSNLFSGDSEGINYIKSHYMNCTNNGYFIKPSYASSVSQIQPEYLQDDYIQIGNDVFKIGKTDYMCFNVSFLNDSGYFLADYGNKQGFGLFNYSPDFSSTKISCIVNPDGKVNKCGPFSSEEDKKRARDVEFSYYTETSLSKVKTCQPGENFNTNTKQCQSCPAGQSWDPETNSCFIDCTDRNKNMWGFTDGSCANCSGEKDSNGVKKCYCNFIGSSPLLQSVELIEGNFRFTSCQNGSQFWYKIPGTPDSDNNNTKPDNPNPGDKPNPGGDSGGGGGNPGGDSGGGSGGGNGGAGGGNGGGKEDKPNPNPGTGDNPGGKPNPNPNPGGGSGGGNGGGDKDKDGGAKFNEGDFNYSDKKREYEDFKNRYGEALNKVLENFDGFKRGIDQFINNVQGKGLSSADKQSKPTTCIKKYDIDFFGYKSSLEFDFCKVASSVSGAFYYIFYAFFFYCFLILIVKILLFAF